MQYCSIDIETTGLNPAKHCILEVGAVLTSIGSKVRHTFRALVVPQDLEDISVSPYTALLHKRLWEELGAFIKGNRLNPFVKEFNYVCSCSEQTIGECFQHWLYQCGLKNNKVTFAGKNAASFDLPFLKARTDFYKYIQPRHRVLDVASHFLLPGDEVLPDLNTCLARAGIDKKTEHGALADALLVCDLVDKVFDKQFAV